MGGLGANEAPRPSADVPVCIKPTQDHERVIVTPSSDTHLATHTVTPARHPRIPAPLALHTPVLLKGRSREPHAGTEEVTEEVTRMSPPPYMGIFTLSSSSS